MKLYKILVMSCLLSIVACQNDPIDKKETDASDKDKEPSIEEFLPMLEYNLSDMSEWTSDGSNWSIVGDAYGDFQTEFDVQQKDGTGTLLNSAAVGEGSPAVTKLQHGDIELELEVLVPKKSNSGIYFQSRYELQIIDSADDEDLSYGDMGGIYSQVEGEPGIAPMINAARSPGLWQKLNVLFRAPRFDAQGKKTSDAMFEHVYLNDALIHKNVSIPQPTLGAVSDEEVAMAPMFFQGDHGPVAFRNIRYKVFDASIKPELTNMTYEAYLGKYDYIPDFDEMEVAKEGTLENFDDLADLAGEREGFSLQIAGDLLIKTSGEYLFETIIDDGGNLYINDELLVHNQGDPGWGMERGIISLEAGTHRLRQSFYQEVWSATLKINVEGPGVEKMELPQRTVPKEIPSWQKEKKLEIEVGDTPELIRAFVDHKGEKKTHVISVGTKEGVHYSFDTRRNQVLNIWKGKFADTGEMWIDRGGSQRLQPLNATIELPTDQALLDFEPLGYTIEPDGLPVFQYKKGELTLSDKITPTANHTALRTISAEGDSFEFEMAAGENIRKIGDGWYSVDGHYFIRLLRSDQEDLVMDPDGNDVLRMVVGPSESIQFEIKW